MYSKLVLSFVFGPLELQFSKLLKRNQANLTPLVNFACSFRRLPALKRFWNYEKQVFEVSKNFSTDFEVLVRIICKYIPNWFIYVPIQDLEMDAYEKSDL